MTAAQTAALNTREYHRAAAHRHASAAQAARSAGDWRTANHHANLSGYHASAIALTR